MFIGVLQDEARPLHVNEEIFLREVMCRLDHPMCNTNVFYKEEKMEKIVVRGYESFKKEVKNKYGKKMINGEHLYFDNDRSFEVFLGSFTSFKCSENFEIDKAVKEFNEMFGTNFEYKPVEVIDTFDKFRNFLSENDFKYCTNFNYIFEKEKESIKDNENLLTMKMAEQKYNVDLKILKEG